jgi:hypothetical protein
VVVLLNESRKGSIMEHDKTFRGNASQFFVAGELCRRGYSVSRAHDLWLKTPGAKGQVHNDSKVRTVHLPPYKTQNVWDISQYLNKWELIEEKMKSEPFR